MVHQSSNAGEANQHHQPQQQPQPWISQQQQQQFPWMAVQYPMMMQQNQMMMVMYPHYPPPSPNPYINSPYNNLPLHHQFQPYRQTPPSPQLQIKGSASQDDSNRTIWIGDLHPWMDETYLYSCFFSTAQVSTVKIIRNKQTGQSEGYGFVEFMSHEAAEKALQSYNGTLMPSVEQPFRLNWAIFSASERKHDAGSDLSIFVGDLAPDVTDTLLQETFVSRYASVKGAKVVTDLSSGRSKGYGFVRFGDENERSRAVTEMNGVYCSSRPMRIGVATPKKLMGLQQQYSSQANGTRFSRSANDPTNTTIFVGGLDSDIADEDLRQTFSQFGEVVSVKIPIGKQCGFVHFANRSDAEDALEKLNGTVIGKHTVRLSWGRNLGSKQLRTEVSSQ